MLDEREDDGEGERTGSCVVTTPPVGFFVAGSSLEDLNGVYVRQTAPTYDEDEPGAHAQQERWRRFYHPFGDPFVHRRKLAAERQKREAEAAARARRKASRAKEKE